MPTLDCVSFSTAGWTPEEASEERIVWSNERQDRLEFSFHNLPPALPPLFPLKGLQIHASENWQTDVIALISLDVLNVRGTSIIRAIMKKVVREERQFYIGMLLLPFRDFFYELRISTHPKELPTSREREIRQELSRNENFQNWQQDPYRQEETSGYLCCGSDNEEYDSRYPEDALALLRGELVKIAASLQTVREVRNSIPFQGTA